MVPLSLQDTASPKRTREGPAGSWESWALKPGSRRVPPAMTEDLGWQVNENGADVEASPAPGVLGMMGETS